MTLAEMRTAVFGRLEEVEGSPVRWSASDIDAAINEGLEELSDATEFYERYANLTLIANQTYYDLRTIVPDTILRVTNLWAQNRNIWLTPTDIRDLDFKTARQWELVRGEPLNYLLRGLWWLGLFPASTDSTSFVRIYYKALHPTLVNNLDRPQQLPEDYHTNLVDYATYTLLVDDMEFTQAMQNYNRYKQAEQALGYECNPGGKLNQSRVGGMGFRK